MRDNRKAAYLGVFVLLLGLLLLVAGCGRGAENPQTSDGSAIALSSTGGRTADTQAQTGPTNAGPVGVGQMGDGYSSSYSSRAVEVQNQAAQAEIVVHGKVVDVGVGRWNSNDGKAWATDNDQDCPLVYRCFSVEPIELIKGEPRFGSPISFIVIGGTEGEVSGPVQVGAEVIVFGNYFASLYGPNAVWPEDAYFARLNEFSIYRNSGDEFVNVGNANAPAFGKTSLDAVRDAVDG